MTNGKTSPSTPQLPIGYWLKKADEVLTARINEAQQASGLTRSEWQILNFLYEGSSVPRSRVEEVLRPFHSGDSLAKAIEGLKARGLVEDYGEGAGLLRLSDRGRELHGKALAIQKKVRERAMEGISEGDYLTAVSVLQRLVANLENPA